MLGVTIAIGNSYRRMAARAAASFAQLAGLETRILSPRLPAERMTKLQLFDLVEEDQFVFFDADTLMIRQADLGFGFVDGFGAVKPYLEDDQSPLWYAKGNARVKAKCHRNTLDPDKYFNSGVMWLDRSKHLELFEQARALPDMGPGDDDELHLNIAAQRMGLPITIFDDRFNRILTGEDDIPADTVIIHAVACRDPMAGRQWVMDLDF